MFYLQLLFQGIKYHLKCRNRKALELLSIIVSVNEYLYQNVLLEYTFMIDLSEELVQVSHCMCHKD
jgi:hypothetical protein